MSRGTSTAVPVTQPILETLPSIYRDGHFLRGFAGGLDAVWSSVFATLDCLHAYVDPAVSPDDFLPWLGEWVGAELDEDWTTERRRMFIARAADIYAARGTATSLAEEIGLYTGGHVRVDDPGSVTTARLPGGRGDARAVGADRTVRVVVDVDGAAGVNWPALQVIVRAAVPAHLPVELELREAGATGDGDVSDLTTDDGAEGGDDR
jgi:phage tail-like protein